MPRDRRDKPATLRQAALRPVYFLLAWCFFALGAIGIAVPGLPTVPLMLVALWLFSRSSRRFHDWLYHHRVFGPPLQQWRTHGVIPIKAKVVALVTMAASVAYMALAARVSWGVLLVTGLVMLVGAVVILRAPSRVVEGRDDAGQARVRPRAPGSER